MIKINIADEFSRFPGGREKVMGPASGEEFRAYLMRRMHEAQQELVEVELDGAEGYGSSFLEEAFGGIIREGLLSAEEALRRVRVVARTREYESYAIEAKRYMLDEAARKGYETGDRRV